MIDGNSTGQLHVHIVEDLVVVWEGIVFIFWQFLSQIIVKSGRGERRSQIRAYNLEVPIKAPCY